jgi:hypothetical protein
MTDKKAPNYTDAQTVAMIGDYNEAQTDAERKAVVELHAIELKKSVASIRMKLVAEKVYIKPGYVSKAGAKSETKSAIVESIAAILNITAEHLPGLDKATVKALNVIRQSYVDLSEELNANVTCDAYDGNDEHGGEELGQPGDRPAAVDGEQG